MPKMSILSFISVLTLLSVSIAFEVTIYNNVDGCKAKDDTMYRIISKSQPIGDSACFTFNKDMPGTDCGQYTDGGAHGPEGCSGGLDPQSVFAKADDGGSCAVYSDENCQKDIVHLSDKCVDAAFLPSKKIKSFKCNGKPKSKSCNAKFTRISTNDKGSLLGTVIHSISIDKVDPKDDMPVVPLYQASCWGLFPNWGKGCGWHKTEKTEVDNGWSVQHQGYTPFDDYSDDVTLYGNGCDNTVLKCTASHGSIQEPDPDGGKLIIIYVSDTHCAPKGTATTASLTSDDGKKILDGLKKDGANLHGWNGDVSKIKPGKAPPPYTCEKVCDSYWKCVDKENDITAYFDGTASFQATMTTAPEVKTIKSGVCKATVSPSAKSSNTAKATALATSSFKA